MAATDKHRTEPVQTSGIGPNLGGPTFSPLGACVPIVNFDWVRKFIELNGEGTQ